MQGSWTAVAQEISGGAWTNEDIEKHEKSITFTDDRSEIRYLDRMGLVQMEKGTYQLDPAHEPAHVDMQGTNRDGHAIEFFGILQVNGDELRHCFVETSDNAGATRPTSFSTSAGRFSTTYRRQGADAVAAANDAGGDWITLFNGRDLTGRTPVASDGG